MSDDLNSARLEKLLKQQNQIKERIKKEQASLREQKRKDDTRRKIIYGGVMIAVMRDNPDTELARRLEGLIESYVRNATDREFLDLNPLSAGKETATVEPEQPERSDEPQDRSGEGRSTTDGLPWPNR